MLVTFKEMCVSSDDDAEPFYDETLWHMRDKSKDHNAFYPEDSYYGVKGVSRMPNRVGLIGCGVIMVMGMVGFWVALRFVLKRLTHDFGVAYSGSSFVCKLLLCNVSGI